jgi:hypothetical protein
MRVCMCGCGRTFSGRKDRKFYSDVCRARYHNKRYWLGKRVEALMNEFSGEGKDEKADANGRQARPDQRILDRI